MKPKALIKEFEIRDLKILDIGYVTVIYFFLGIGLAKLFDKLYGKFNPKEEAKKSFLRQTFELIGMMWISGVVIYIVRNLVELIPSPFNGIVGFDHQRVKELKNATVFAFIFLFFQSYFKDKLQYYYNNLKL